MKQREDVKGKSTESSNERGRRRNRLRTEMGLYPPRSTLLCNCTVVGEWPCGEVALFTLTICVANDASPYNYKSYSLGSFPARLVEIGYAITIAITTMTEIARTVSLFFNLVGLLRNYASEKKIYPSYIFLNIVAKRLNSLSFKDE